MRLLLRYCFLCFLTWISAGLNAQVGQADNCIIFSTEGGTASGDSSSLFVIRDITISGNVKTKSSTILREIPFELNQHYNLHTIAEQFYEAKRHLMNTGLFRNVVVSLQSLQGHDVYINVDVEERWYIYPVPFVKPIDNSFFAWATQKDRDLERLNYGLKVTYKNFTGRNDKLYVYFMNGYTKKVELLYHGLYLDRDMKWYTNFNVQYGKNREVNYMTNENQPVPLKASNDYLHTFFRSYVAVNYRKAIKTTHTFGIGFQADKVSDSVHFLNPEFSPGSGTVKYAQVFYKMTKNDLDFIPYPTKGYATELQVSKKGFNQPVDLWHLVAKTSAYFPLNEKTFFNLRLVGTIKLPFEQPYITQQFIGYDGMFLQGFENYVIDGVAGGYAKAIIAHPIFSSTIRVPSNKLDYRLKRFSTIPFRVFAKAFVNAGYVYNSHSGNNILNNRLLYSGGVGLDVVTFTDFVIKIEWSLNQLGQNGLYLHPRNNF